VVNDFDYLKEFCGGLATAFLARLLSRVTFRLSVGRMTIAGFL
jgi:hypothetical protein